MKIKFCTIALGCIIGLFGLTSCGSGGSSSSNQQNVLSTNLTPLDPPTVRPNSRPISMSVVSFTSGISILYSSSPSSSVLSTFSIESSGALTSGVTPSTSFGNPIQIAVGRGTPSQRLLVISSSQGNRISYYSIQNNGNLTVGGFARLPASPFSLMLSSGGNIVYVLSRNSESEPTHASNVPIDPDGSVNIPVDTIVESGMTKIVVNQSSRFAYLLNSTQNHVVAYGRDDNGSLTRLRSESVVDTGNNPSNLLLNGSKLYVLNQLDNSMSVFDVNQTTGGLTRSVLQPTISTGSSPYTITISKDGNYLYVGNWGVLDSLGLRAGDSSISSYQIDPENGLLTRLADIITPQLPVDAVLDPSGSFIYFANSTSRFISGYRIN